MIQKAISKYVAFCFLNCFTQIIMGKSPLAIIFVLFLFGCQVNELELDALVDYPLTQINEQLFELKNGQAYIDGKAFTGRIFACYPLSSDTLEVRGYYEGREHGMWKKYYPSGKLREKRYYDRGRKTGDYFTYWENL